MALDSRHLSMPLPVLSFQGDFCQLQTVQTPGIRARFSKLVASFGIRMPCQQIEFHEAWAGGQSTCLRGHRWSDGLYLANTDHSFKSCRVVGQSALDFHRLLSWERSESRYQDLAKPGARGSGGCAWPTSDGESLPFAGAQQTVSRAKRIAFLLRF